MSQFRFWSQLTRFELRFSPGFKPSNDSLKYETSLTPF